MTTLYIRTFDLKDSLSDAEVLEHWRVLTGEVIPACQKMTGTRSIKVFSGAGALRADLTLLWEMDDAGVYERALLDPALREMIGKMYRAWDLKTAGQSFCREVTSELIQALGGSG